MHARASTQAHAVGHRFLEDHDRHTEILERMRVALGQHDDDAASMLWGELCGALLTHLEAEETFLLPELLRGHERDARVLLQEHRHIRTRLNEIGRAVDARTVGTDALRDLADELAAHERHESHALYAWVDAHVDEATRTAAIDALDAPPHSAARKTSP